jgi:hypothetical protein
MSFHYTVAVSTNLRRDLEAADVELLDYLFNAGAVPPTVDAADTLRSAPLSMVWLREYRARGSDPSSASLVEVSRKPDGEITWAQLFLFVPGNKLEGIFEEWLQLLRWLATLIPVDGHFATVMCEDGGQPLPFLFHSYGGKLFMKGVKEPNVVHSLDSDERRELALG